MSVRRLLLLCGFFAAATCSFAQSSIRYDAAKQQWTIEAGEMSYILGVNDERMLQTLYWGQRLSTDASLPAAFAIKDRSSFDAEVSSTPLEYAGWGKGLYTEPALKVTFADGNRTLVLRYDGYKQDGDTLEITLRDTVQPVFVHLFYKSYPKQGILARWSRIENRGGQVVTVEQAESASWNLPPGKNYERSWLTGRWGGEWQMHTALVETGVAVLESRRGSTSHQTNPWFAIGRRSETNEESGPVWFGELGWSGSWRIAVEDTSFDQVRVTGGYNPFDFSYKLDKGQSLETPRFYAGFTAHGQGGASRLLHRFQREVILPRAPESKPRPIVYNSWEATGFAVTETGQLELAQKAAALGVERFVIDDGWFGERKDDGAGLGDWQVNRTKFPNGLKPVVDRVRGLGMDFGLWVEPEMVNPDSALYRAHPDWVMSFAGRPSTEERNQLVLNLARADVKEFVFDFLNKLVSENDIAFLKWDYNRNWSEPGWASAPRDKQKEIYVQYVENLYEILARLRQAHPELEIESCSGGGGRVDLGILKYTEEVWPSDNTDALDRLDIQDGFTHAYAPATMVSWVTDTPNYLDKRVIPLEFRFLVAMGGALGIGGNLNHWTPEEMQLGKRLVEFDKRVRETVQEGLLYRLARPGAGDESSVEYVAQDGKQALLLAYLHSQRLGSPYGRVRLQGLEPNLRYKVSALDAAKYAGEEVVSGSALMNEGVSLRLAGDYDSTALLLERVAAPEGH